MKKNKMLFIGFLILLEILLAIGFVELSWKLSLLFLFYLTSYLDGKEFTGERRWPEFRKFKLWKRLSPAHDEYLSAQNELLKKSVRTKGCLYVFKSESTSLFPLLWSVGIGLPEDAPHGARIFFLLDHFFFRVPLLREVLLWMGAISRRSNIIKLLNERKHICVYERDLTEDLLQYALDQKGFIVPVLCKNDLKRYFCYSNSHIFFSIPRWWQRRYPPEKLSVLVGTVITCDDKFQGKTSELRSFIDKWYEKSLGAEA
jgi:hypothetical protein